MKRKNIFKTLALAMLMPAMLLTTACSSEDDLTNNTVSTQPIAKKGYALPVTVDVTRGGDAATRATYNATDKKLEFSSGDKLFVQGSDYPLNSVGQFAGTLTWVSDGTFSGTITTQHEWTKTAAELFEHAISSGGSVSATLLPAGYESYDYLEIMDDGYEALLGESANNSFATSKKLAVEQLSYETGSYTSGTGFTLNPQNAILNFTVTGFVPNTIVTASLSDGSPLFNIEGDVTTDGSGNATFAMGVEANTDLKYLSLTVAGNPVTLVNSSTELEAGHIYNITRAVTPPTLAQTMNTAGMTVKVKYNYENGVNYCLFSSNGDGTYTFQSGYGWAGGKANCAKALVVEGGKLVFKQNFYDTIDFLWSNYGFSVTFDTSNNSYIQFVGPSTQEFHNPSFISVEVNSVPIALTKIITVADLVKEDGQSWSVIIANNPGKIKEESYYVVRVSDNAKLQRNMYGDVWHAQGDSPPVQSGQIRLL